MCLPVIMIVFIAMEASQGGSGEVAVITPTVTNTTDLTQVLSGLQNSGELTSVLQQQPHLVEGTFAQTSSAKYPFFSCS